MTLVTAKNQKTRLERARIRTCYTFNRFYLQAYLYTSLITKNFLTKYPQFATQKYHSIRLLQKKMHFFEFLRLFCALSPHICIEQLIYNYTKHFGRQPEKTIRFIISMTKRKNCKGENHKIHRLTLIYHTKNVTLQYANLVLSPN